MPSKSLQHVGIDVRQANQYGIVVGVVVRHVVNIGRRGEQSARSFKSTRMTIEPGSADRLAGIQARSFPWTLSAGTRTLCSPPRRARASPIFRTVSKFIPLFGILRVRLSAKTATFKISRYGCWAIFNREMWRREGRERDSYLPSGRANKRAQMCAVACSQHLGFSTRVWEKIYWPQKAISV